MEPVLNDEELWEKGKGDIIKEQTKQTLENIKAIMEANSASRIAMESENYLLINYA